MFLPTLHPAYPNTVRVYFDRILFLIIFGTWTAPIPKLTTGMSIDRKQELCELWLPVIYGDLRTVVESLDRCPHLINKVDPVMHL